MRHTLTDAIAKGGSTLRDYVDSDGRPGFFQQGYFVYGRTGLPCRVTPLPARSERGQDGECDNKCDHED